MLPAEFEPAIPVSKGPQMNAIDRATTGIGIRTENRIKFKIISVGLKE